MKHNVLSESNTEGPAHFGSDIASEDDSALNPDLSPGLDPDPNLERGPLATEGMVQAEDSAGRRSPSATRTHTRRES